MLLGSHDHKGADKQRKPNKLQMSETLIAAALKSYNNKSSSLFEMSKVGEPPERERKLMN